MSKTVFHAAGTRGHANHGWLNAHHSFSFAQYYDPSRIHFGVLRVLNDDIVRGGTGFGKHPHDNMEIISVVLDGEIGHKDSMGHEERIRVNEVQVMSAGTGIEHSEYNHLKDKDLNLLQIWIFPKRKDVEPRYDQRAFDPADRENRLQLQVSPIDSSDEGLKIHQDAWIYRARVEAGKSLTHTLHQPGNGVYAFVIDGSLTIEGQELNKRDAVGISETGEVAITANSNSDLLLIEVPMTL
ncbi:MAG: pirin family protein [Flavipsychrobacter sp.]|nr:pirin family protein [Flavipsychrobacter sp.]